MQQLSISFDAPPLAQARNAGEAATALAEGKARQEVLGFSEKAAAYILASLRANGPTSGEALTESCRAAGIAPADSRAFGGVYQRLARRGEIVCLRADLPRARGHGTAGGRLWSAA